MNSVEPRIVPIRAVAGPPGVETDDEVGLYEIRKKIYVRSVTGIFASWRVGLVIATQVVFYGLPWLYWNGRQAVLFDLGARKFYIFGLVFWPQDVIYLTVLLILSALSLFLFTAVAGRLWCGYACPQTVYTEIFLWIERKIEGDRQARMKLDAAPRSLEKFVKKALKHTAWIALAIWTGYTFVGYFEPIRDLGVRTITWGLGGWETFWIVFYALATYGNAGWMREQVCKYMCPYARFQSVMFDKDTMIVTYDQQRGDPRGTRSRKIDARAAGLGDCIDCGLCVQVCPTGIDIRKGLQYECIGCAACIDVCDGVMDKMQYPRGLVRFATQHGLENHWTRNQMLRHVLRPRVLVYTAILLAIVTAFVTSLALREPFRVDVVRDRGVLARTVGEGVVENVYRLQIMNATEHPQRYTVRVTGMPGAEIATRPDFEVGPTEARWVPVTVQLPPEAAAKIGAGAQPLEFEVERLPGPDENAVTLREKSTFVIPR